MNCELLAFELWILSPVRVCAAGLVLIEKLFPAPAHITVVILVTPYISRHIRFMFMSFMFINWFSGFFLTGEMGISGNVKYIKCFFCLGQLLFKKKQQKKNKSATKKTTMWIWGEGVTDFVWTSVLLTFWIAAESGQGRGPALELPADPLITVNVKTSAPCRGLWFLFSSARFKL